MASSFLITYGLLGVMISAFLSYSILPLPFEPALISSLKFYDPYTVFIAALIGSTLGGITNYLIGFFGVRQLISKSKKERRAEKIFEKWGPTSIVFLSWIPLIGDPLITLAGTLKMKFWKFLIYSSIPRIIYIMAVIWFGFTLANKFQF